MRDMASARYPGVCKWGGCSGTSVAIVGPKPRKTIIVIRVISSRHIYVFSDEKLSGGKFGRFKF